MPNGGSDCCGTCWFNAKNKGAAGYAHANDPEPDFCSIRQFQIANPFYTYCANHPHRRPLRDHVPIGPVFTADDDELRRLSLLSPDSENIRTHLLALLAQIRQQPASEYPFGSRVDEVVVWQIGEFCDQRATSDLERIASFEPSVIDRFGHSRDALVLMAREALVKIAAKPPEP
jgi:hypothetical protein